MEQKKSVRKKKNSKLMNAFRKVVILGLAVTSTKILMIADEATNDQYGPNKAPILSDLTRAEKKWQCGDDCQSFSRFLTSQAQSQTPNHTYQSIQYMKHLPIGQSLVDHAHDSNITMRANDPEFKERPNLHGQFNGKMGIYSYRDNKDMSARESLSVAWHEMYHMHQYSHGLKATSIRAEKDYSPKDIFLTKMVMEISAFTFDKIMMHRYHLAGAPGMKDAEKQDLKDYVQEFSDFYQLQIKEGVKPQEAEKITAQAMFRFHVQSAIFQEIRGTYVRRLAPQQNEMMKPATDALKISDLQKLAEMPGSYSFLPPEFSIADFNKQMLQDLQQNWTNYIGQEKKAAAKTSDPGTQQSPAVKPQTAQICYSGPEEEIQKINKIVQDKIKQGL